MHPPDLPVADAAFESRTRKFLRAIGLAPRRDPEEKVPLLARVLIVCGAISLYNVFSHYQTIIDLSRSIHWFAGWWRYIIGFPFEILRIELSPLQREVLVLLLFFTASANLTLRRKHSRPLLATWLDFYSDESVLTPRADRMSWAIEAVIFIVLGTTALLVATESVIGLIWLTAFVGVLLLINSIVYYIYPIRRSPPRSLFAVLAVVNTPFLLMFRWADVLARHYREIIRSLAVLLGILVLDICFKYTLDPLFERFPELPAAPLPSGDSPAARPST